MLPGMDRRLFLSLMSAFPLAPAPQATEPPPLVRTVATIPLPPPYDKQTASMVELYLAPGAPSSAPHRHPGFVLGYVIEGQFRFQIAGQPERTIRAGETFYEPPGAQHLVSASAIADSAARVLAIVIAESGHPITEPL